MYLLMLYFKKIIDKIDSTANDKNKLLFYVSIDRLKENHKKIRGKNTFDIEGIKDVINKGYSVVTNIVINKLNYDDVIDRVVFLKTMGVKDVQLSNLIMQGNATKDLKINLNDQLTLKDKLSILYKEHPEFGYIYIILKFLMKMVLEKCIH